jgi:hypothetical protein
VSSNSPTSSRAGSPAGIAPFAAPPATTAWAAGSTSASRSAHEAPAAMRNGSAIAFDERFRVIRP